jgi:uncharacterized protein (DUF849 family)
LSSRILSLTLNTFLRNLGEGGTRFELECYDVGHLYNLAYFVDREIIKPPIFIQAIFGILGGIGPDPENLLLHAIHSGPVVRTRHLSVFGIGRRTSPDVPSHDGSHPGCKHSRGAGRQPLSRPGVKATSNAEQVRKIRNILAELSLEIATPAETREILHLKGPENVHFA